MERDSRLLIVDDNAPTRYAMRRVLERHGYQVLEAGTGSEGLELVANAAPDALMAATDLPSTRADRPFDDADIALIETVLGPGLARAALHDTAAAFYRA